MQLKKILVSLLVAMMILSMAVVSASAATTFDVAVESGSTAIEVGNTVEVNVVINNNPGAEAINVVVEYDAAVFELVEVTTTSDIYNFSDSELGHNGVVKADGKVTLISDLNTKAGDVTKTGTIATITLKVIAEQTACENLVEITSAKAYNAASVKLESTVNGLSFHAFGEAEVTAPTCTEAGQSVIACAVCDYVITTELPATGHVEEVIPAVAATCTAEGTTEGKKCSACGEVLVAPTATEKAAHTEEVIPATKGFTEGKKCSVCNEVLVAPAEAPANLTWLWIVIAAVVVVGVVAVVVVVAKKKK